MPEIVPAHGAGGPELPGCTGRKMQVAARSLSSELINQLMLIHVTTSFPWCWLDLDRIPRRKWPLQEFSGRESNAQTSRRAGRPSTGRMTDLLFFVRLTHLQHRKERFLRNLHASDAFHPLLAFLLLLEELALAGDVAAVALGQDVFAERADGLAGDDFVADRGLQRYFEHLARNQLAQARDQIFAA